MGQPSQRDLVIDVHSHAMPMPLLSWLADLGLADVSGAADEVRRELKLLKNDLRISARLIEQGMTFCRAWAKLLGTGPAYTQSGRQEPSPSQGIVSLRG